MGIKYGKFYAILANREIKIKDLVKSSENPDGLLSSATMAKLKKGDYINTQTIEKLCEFLNVQPGDLMEYIPDKKPTE